MKNTAVNVVLAASVLTPLASYAQPRPGNPTTATVITKTDIDKIFAPNSSSRFIIVVDLCVRTERVMNSDYGDGAYLSIKLDSCSLMYYRSCC